MTSSTLSLDASLAATEAAGKSADGRGTVSCDTLDHPDSLSGRDEPPGTCEKTCNQEKINKTTIQRTIPATSGFM